MIVEMGCRGRKSRAVSTGTAPVAGLGTSGGQILPEAETLLLNEHTIFNAFLMNCEICTCSNQKFYCTHDIFS